MTMTDLLYVNLNQVIHWPETEDLVVSMPTTFLQKFGTKVAYLYARAQTWSNYKLHNTAKYLIGITTQGSFRFISEGLGGRVNDKYKATKSGFIKNLLLLPGDIVLADCGFNIDELIATVAASIHIPAFTK